MNKPKNKKKCSGCLYFHGNKYGKNKGIFYGVCDADLRTKSDCSCKDWTPKKYNKKDRRKFNFVLEGEFLDENTFYCSCRK